MPTKNKPGRDAPRDLPAIPKELIDQFVNGPMSAEAIQDASMAFEKVLIERALGVGKRLWQRSASPTTSLPETTPCPAPAHLPSSPTHRPTGTRTFPVPQAEASHLARGTPTEPAAAMAILAERLRSGTCHVGLPLARCSIYLNIATTQLNDI